MERTHENLEKIIESYKRFFSTPNPDDPDFQEENVAFNYLRELDENKAYSILYSLDKLGVDRDFLRRVTVDHKIEHLTPNVGGYFSLNQNYIGLNSAILRHSSINTIVHIIYHEALHAGVVKELDGVRVKDEALVEFITTQKMKQIFGKDDFRSGYSEIVSELENLLGVSESGKEFIIQSVIDQIESDNVLMLDKFLEIIVLNPLINSGNISYLTYSEIEDELRKKWHSILKLFPRLVNDIDSPNKGPHEEALMQVDGYKFQNLLDKAAERIFSNPYLMLKILDQTFSSLGKYIDDENSLKLALRDLGYGYLVNYAETYGLRFPTFVIIEQ